MVLREIDRQTASRFVVANHYSPVFPRVSKHRLGLFIDDELVGVLTLGWGTQPVATIRKLFPSLGTADYLEIGKMCVLDSQPRNTETQFLSLVMKWVKEHRPELKFIFTWADGIFGKVGYVYQAANFWYGGHIWTQTYMTRDGERLHPRRLQTLYSKRPTPDLIKQDGLRQVQGKQFRYIYPLNRTARKMLSSSTVKWTQNEYPKNNDLDWKERTDGGYVQMPEPPEFFFPDGGVNHKSIAINLRKVGT